MASLGFAFDPSSLGPPPGGSGNLAVALALAAEGYAVFPCDATKRPLAGIMWRRQSTSDQRQIEHWWQRDPDAMPGLDLAKAGLLVVDVDCHDGGEDGLPAWEALVEEAGGCDAPQVTTPSGGRHVYFRQLPGASLGNGRGALPKGIDVRGAGGYVIGPGAVRRDGGAYSPAEIGDAPPLPDWLAAILRERPTEPAPEVPAPASTAPEAPATSRLPAAAPALTARLRAYADAAFDREIAAVRSAGKGQRNQTLNTAAFAFGQMVAAGWLLDIRAIAALEDAAIASGLARDDGIRSVRATIRSGLAGGRRQPREVPSEIADDAGMVAHGAAIAGNIILGSREKVQAQAASDLEWFDDIEPVINAPYLIKEMIDRSTMSVVYGPSNSGKTFFVLDLVFHISIETPWRGRKVNGGSVLYLAAEGGNGIVNRIAALRQTYGVMDVPLALRRAGLDLLKPNADTTYVIALAEETAKRAPLALIVIDTLSRVMAGGDENAAEDMTAFVRNVDRIRQATGAHIMIVHHTGKDAARGARGHSSLKAAVDTEIEIVVDEFGNRTARVIKQRDYAGREEFAFGLRQFLLGKDNDGDEISTCVVEALEKPAEDSNELPPIDTCRMLLRAIGEAWTAKNPLSIAPQTKNAGRFAPRVLGRQFHLKPTVVQRLIESWLDNQIVTTDVVDTDTKRRGLRVLKLI